MTIQLYFYIQHFDHECNLEAQKDLKVNQRPIVLGKINWLK